MDREQSAFGRRVMDFNAGLHFSRPLPPGVHVMNPFRENACATPASAAFYHKYYNDNKERRAIMGINPGRFGAGITGVPFTDPIRLAQYCHINIPECPKAREPSSEFVYDVIEAYGGPDLFYSSWYINSFCPLGFTRENEKGRQVNFNYYDDPGLEKTVESFIVECVEKQIAFGLRRDVCFCLGSGKNFKFISGLNAKHKFFAKILPLAHPRFIIQYRSRERSKYVREYIERLRPYA